MRLSILTLLMTCSVAALGQQFLTLEQCRELALAYNQDVKSADLNIQSASSLVQAAKGDFQPTLDLSGSYRRLSNAISYNGFETAGVIDDFYNARLSVSQNIYSGSKVKYNHELAQQKKSIAVAQKELSASEVTFQTDQAYWNVVALAELLTLSQAYQNVITNFLVVVRDKVEAEIVPRNDLLQGQVRLNEADLLVLRSQNALQITRMNLNRLIGFDINTGIQTDDSISVDLATGDQSNINQRALQNRAELKIRQGEVDASLLQEKLTVSKYLPSIGVGLSGRYGVPAGGPNFNDPDVNGSGFAFLALPIYYGGRKRNELAASKFNSQVSQLQLEKTRDLVTLEVTEAQYTLNESVKQVNLTNNSLGQASENLDLVTERYREGLANIIEVFDAQIFWQRAYKNFIDSKTGYQINKSKFQRALGELYSE